MTALYDAKTDLVVAAPEPFTLHSGGSSKFKLEADVLTRPAVEAAAQWLLPTLGAFGSVEFVPSQSNDVPQWLADAFLPHVVEGSRTVLICDDVLTTGASMEAKRAHRLGVGAVVFARGPAPHWIHALLHLDARCRSL